MCKDRISFTGNLSIHLVNVQRGLCVPLIAHFFPWLFIASIQAQNPFGEIQALDLASHSISFYAFLSICLPFFFFCFEHSS